ncbi:GNAT family N-acetyltransferase [Thermodesulfobacteriota bacterium]
MIKINNAQIKIRSAASNSDKLFLSNLSKKAFSTFGDYEEVVLKWFESEYSRTLIATYKEIPAGFAMLSKPIDRYDPNNSAELLAIAVVSEYSRLGIGSNLTKRIDELAYETGTKMIFLHTATENKYALKLFSSSGFRVWQTKKEFYPKGQDAFVMMKEIE